MRRYGRYNTEENTTNCIVEVFGEFNVYYQCQRKRGHGKKGLLCKQHARIESEGRPLNIPKNKRV